MRTSITLLLLITVLLSINLYGQDEGDPVIYNFSNKEQFEDFQQRDLDSHHMNLFNPELAKEEFELVSKKWMEIHQAISQHLKKTGFNWNIEDSTVSIVHKIYFHKNGKIKAHFFNVLDENIDAETKKEFAKCLKTFASGYSIDLIKDYDYAQCGKTKYFTKSD